VASASTEVDEIRRQMAQIRRELHEDVREVVATAEAVTDWRRFIRMYPWPALGAAAAVGYLIVPKRRRSVPRDVARQTDIERVREAVEESRAAERGREKTRKGLLAGALALIGPVVVRAAQGYAVRHLEHWISQMQMDQMAAGPAHGPSPSSSGPGWPGGPGRPGGSGRPGESGRPTGPGRPAGPAGY
jgi:hypothetical protein